MFIVNSPLRFSEYPDEQELTGFGRLKKEFHKFVHHMLELANMVIETSWNHPIFVNILSVLDNSEDNFRKYSY